MSSDSDSDLPIEQIDGFLRGFFFLKRELNTLSHYYVTTGLPEELAARRKHLDSFFFKGGASRNIENIDLFFNFCLTLGDHRNSMTMGELSQVLLLPMSTATRIVDWLVEGAYVERLSDPDDRRVVKVALTDTGREMYRALYEFAARQMPRILEQFSEEERAHLIALVHKLARILSEEMR